jgi:F-type H+-transporting ATPase subunit gamma
MRREQALRRQLHSLDVLGEAVNAMKSLSAHHLRAARSGLTAAREYREGIARFVASAAIAQEPPRVSRPGLLVVAADLGLCGGYNTHVAASAIREWRQLGAAAAYCVGRRALRALRRAGVPIAKDYSSVTSVAGLTNLLLRLADDALGDYLSGEISGLHVVSARFDGVGSFTAVSTRVLPLALPAAPRTASTAYVGREHLRRIAVREYLYSTLFALLLDALAAEHGARLVATQSAGQWLDDRIADLGRQLSSIQREAGTQEVLEVAAGTRQRRVRRGA